MGSQRLSAADLQTCYCSISSGSTRFRTSPGVRSLGHVKTPSRCSGNLTNSLRSIFFADAQASQTYENLWLNLPR